MNESKVLDEGKEIAMLAPGRYVKVRFVEYNDAKWVDIRLYYDNERYSGPSKRGLRLSLEQAMEIFGDLKELLAKSY